jgi:uncharacterized protein (DUF2141 family)
MRLALLAGLLLASPAFAADLLVTVHGVSAEPGTIMVTACPPDSFADARCLYRARAPAHPGDVVVTLAGLPGGRWALKAFHDRDGNFKLGTDWLGRPTEPVGFGNDAPIGRFGPPSFEAASVVVPATGRFQTALTLRYR